MENAQEQLRDAVWTDDMNEVRNLVSSRSVDINYADAGSQTILHLAAFWGKLDAVKYLIANGANVKAGCSPLDLAIHWGHVEVAQIIRFQGGSSLWEERLSKLQLKVEDSDSRENDLKIELDAATSSLKVLRNEKISLHVAHAKLERKVLELHELRKHHRLELLLAKKASLIWNERYDELTHILKQSIITETKARQDCQYAKDERNEAMKQREILLQQYALVIAGQNDAIHKWKSAEAAAAVADSSRNKAFVERDKYKYKAEATAADLHLLQQRFDAVQIEFHHLKEETSEYLEAKRKAEIKTKRAERAIEELTYEKRVMALRASKDFSERIHAEQHVIRTQKKLNQVALDRNAVHVKAREAEQRLTCFQREFVDTVRAFAGARGNGSKLVSSTFNLREQWRNGMVYRDELNLKRIMTPQAPCLTLNEHAARKRRPKTVDALPNL